MSKQLKRFFALVLALAMIVGYMPISTVQAEAASKVSVKSLKLNKTQYVLKKGKTVKLKATVSPKKAKVTWTSSNKKVATVSKKGVVKAVASKGTAKITAKSGKKKATCKIIIGTPVKKISASNMKLTVGDSKKIKASISPKNAKVKTLTYESKNKSVATVNKSGKVTGKKAGKAKIVITAKDCAKVKKTITVQVLAKQETPKATATPAVTKVPTATKAPTATPTPKVSMTVTTPDVPLKAGEGYTPELKVSSEIEKDIKVTWTSSDSNVAAVVGADGAIQALTPGECTITGVSKEDASLSVSYKVTVGKETEVVVTTGEELATALASGEAAMITLNTQEPEINIPEGDYSNVTLVVNAPNAHIVNKGKFKNVLIKGISENTWIETYGNKIFMNSPTGHIRVDAEGNPNVYLLDETEQITVTNDGNLQELLIASAAKVLVKGDSVASRVACDVYTDGAEIDVYVPLDIYSTTTYKLNVGPGGEQTAIKVDEENSIPQISGIGTLSVTIDSTGENKTVIAENDGSIKDLPTTLLTGHVVTEETVAVGAKVYLVSYSKEVNGENISVYLNGSATKETKTDEEGTYTFNDVAVGNYIIVVEAEGYELITQNIYIPTTYANNTYEMEDIILMSDAGQVGGITGAVYNAESGEVIADGLTVFLRKGMNNITTTEVQKTTTDAQGNYEFKDVVPGQYTIQIRDERETAVYVSDYYNVSVLSGAVITKNMTVSKRLDSQELRFVLTWNEQGENVSEDLDIHLYAPYPHEDKEYEIHFGDGSMYHYGYDMNFKYGNMAVLDVDDKEYAGPETITVKNIAAGQYKVFVQDYTNGGAGSSLAASKPQIKVYMGNTLLDTLKMPEKTGGVWYACNYDANTGKLTAVNDVYSGKPNETTKAKIGTLFNRLEQFEVIDTVAFAKDQTLIDSIKEDYLKQQDETVLTTYLQQLQELLEKLKAGLTMTEISGNGISKETYNTYQSYHYMYYFYGTEETLPDLNVTFKDTESVTSYTVEPMEDTGYHKLTIKNHTLGVATAYRFYYHQETEYWVEGIEDANNPEWKVYINQNTAKVGGLNDSLGRELEFKFMDGITLDSIEYKEDLKENWNYEEAYDAVLHLKKTSTGATRDYLIKYIPLGAELNGITDSDNIILEVENNYDWDYEYANYDVEVFGENKELGTTWKPQVREGATYNIQYPEEIEDETFNAQARVTVSYGSKAEVVYDIHYYQDTSAAELVGVHDANNMYTRYDVYTSYVSGGREYYNIQLEGTNSKLGTDLKVYTRNGAKAEIEYATASESFEGYGSDAKITITAENGVQRTYYIIYKKTNDEINLRGIDSIGNDLKKVYSSYGDIYILGTQEKLGNDLSFKTNEGYEASYDSDNNEILVTQTATGDVKTYSVRYTQDTSCVNLKKVSSKSQSTITCSIDNYASVVTTTEDKEEKIYRVSLVGDTKECPTDLVAGVEYGNQAEFTYASNGENWIYSEEYVAKILVKDATGFSKTYLVTYMQDASQAIIKDIKDDNNSYVYKDIDSYNSTIRCEDGTSEEVYIIQLIGNNKTLGDTYQLSLPTGTKVASKVCVGEEGWNYQAVNRTQRYTDKTTGTVVRVKVKYVERIVIEAANGAQKVYVISYGQDESNALVTGITDTKNTYLGETLISDSSTTMDLKEEADGVSTEDVFLIFVKGDNPQLGTTYQVAINENANIVETIHAGEENWNYMYTHTERSYYDENDEYVSQKYTYASRVVIEAANGARRVYVIAYAQDVSGTAINGITDDKNIYIEEPRINVNPSYMSFREYKDDVYGEDVYMIYVYGANETLGSTYQLSIPEGSVITETIHAGEEGWNYAAVTTNESWYDSEKKDYVSRTYTYSDRVVIKAKNGAQRVYVIAYAQDDSGTIVTGITDDNNTYLEQPIISQSRTTLYYNEEVDGVSTEDVYMVYVYGKNGTLGSTYKLDMPEESIVESAIRVGEEGWNYEARTIVEGSYNEEDEYVLKTYTLSDRVVVKAVNGAKRVYVIAYLADESGIVVKGITDTENVYSETPVISEETERLRLIEAVNDSYYENVHMIYVYGENGSLGTTYQLDLPEGSVVDNTIRVGEEGWNYSQTELLYGHNDENGNYLSRYYTLTDRVVVKAANGIERVYVIAYAQDASKASVNKIEDTENIYTLEPYISDTTETLYYSESDETVSNEEVYMIYVYGNNKELGNTYKLTIPEGSTIAETTCVNEEGWKYSRLTMSHSHKDENDETVTVDYTLAARVVVEASNGVSKIYVIAYAQDERGAIPSALTDENNIFSQEPVISASETTVTVNTEDGSTIQQEVYVIQAAGGNPDLGDTYQLTLPEGAEIVSVSHVGDENWKYVEERQRISYTNLLGVTKREYAYFADAVVIRATNGAERTYLIAYLQDISGIEASNISDAENEGFTLMSFGTSPTEMTVAAVDESGAETTTTKEVYVILVQGSNETLGNSYTLQMPEGTTEVSRISNTQDEWKYQETTVDGYTYESEVTIKATNGAERTYLIAYAQITE